MHRVPWSRQFSRRLVLATSCFVLLAPQFARGQLRPNPDVLADASPELLDRLRADPFVYFRFINRAWTSRVCELFADVGYRRGLSNPDDRLPEPAIVRHLREQVPVTRAAFLAWGETLMRPMDEPTARMVVTAMGTFERFVLPPIGWSTGGTG